MSAQLIAFSVPGKDVEAGQEFYGALTGTKFAHTPIKHPTYHAWVAAGVKLNVEAPYSRNQQPMCQFLVDDLGAAVRTCVKAGGKLVVKPFDLTMDPRALEMMLVHYDEVWGRKPAGATDKLGQCAIVQDPNSNQVGLVQLDKWAADEYSHGHLTDFHRKEQDSSVRFCAAYHGG